MKKKILLAGLGLSSVLGAESKEVLAIAGSTRTHSYNKKLLQEAVTCAKKMGAKVTVVDLRDYPMPFYDGDDEEKHGMPPNAKKLRELIKKSDVLIIASPEYNSSMSAVLKNAIDWVSRSTDGVSGRDILKDKKIALMSTSLGNTGGKRGLVHLRHVLEDLDGEPLVTQVCVPKASQAFNEQGKLVDEAVKQEIERQIQELLQ